VHTLCTHLEGQSVLLSGITPDFCVHAECGPECARAAREQSKADMGIASRFGALRERRRHSSATTRFIMLPNAVPLTGSTPMLGSLLEAHPQRFRLEFSRSRPLWILRGPPKTREIFGAGALSSGMPDLLGTFRPAGQIPEVQLLGARNRTPGRPVPSALAFVGRG
jgi:hypothetical protein